MGKTFHFDIGKKMSKTVEVIRIDFKSRLIDLKSKSKRYWATIALLTF
jgi:hypothetical protein